MERKYVSYLPLLNFDKTYRESVNPMIIPCGADTMRTKHQIKEFMSYIFTEAGLCDVMVASCDCGATMGSYRVGSYCLECQTVVRHHNSVELGYNTWLQIPEALPPLIQPLAYHVISNWIKTNQSKLTLDMLLDPDGCDKLPPAVAERFGCGANYFYQHFDEIMQFLLYEYRPLMVTRLTKPRGNTEKQIERTNDLSKDMVEWLATNREAIFARYFQL